MRFSIIGLTLTILLDALLFVNFLEWNRESVYEFEQRQLDLQVNYAVDAAIQEMLSNTTDINTDYVNWGEMTVEPETALFTYESVLIRNLGWSDSEKNRQDLEELSIPFFIVAAYDGYYVYSKQHEKSYTWSVNGGGFTTSENVLRNVFGDNYKSLAGKPNGYTVNNTYDLRWSPKLPYAEEVSPDLYRFYYLGDNQYGTLKFTRSPNTIELKYDNIDTTPKQEIIGRGFIVVSETLTNACNMALYRGLEGHVDKQWYIPASMSEWSQNNPVKTPSVLTYMAPSGAGSRYDTVTFGIGGAKVDDAEFCICYKKNGEKLYTHAYNRDKLPSGVTIDRIVTSPREAAKVGYWYDISFR